MSGSDIEDDLASLRSWRFDHPALANQRGVAKLRDYRVEEGVPIRAVDGCAEVGLELERMAGDSDGEVGGGGLAADGNVFEHTAE